MLWLNGGSKLDILWQFKITTKKKKKNTNKQTNKNEINKQTNKKQTNSLSTLKE